MNKQKERLRLRNSAFIDVLTIINGAGQLSNQMIKDMIMKSKADLKRDYNSLKGIFKNDITHEEILSILYVQSILIPCITRNIEIVMDLELYARENNFYTEIKYYVQETILDPLTEYIDNNAKWSLEELIYEHKHGENLIYLSTNNKMIRYRNLDLVKRFESYDVYLNHRYKGETDYGLVVESGKIGILLNKTEYNFHVPRNTKGKLKEHLVSTEELHRNIDSEEADLDRLFSFCIEYKENKQ